MNGVSEEGGTTRVIFKFSTSAPAMVMMLSGFGLLGVGAFRRIQRS
jgi:hypothetical protein